MALEQTETMQKTRNLGIVFWTVLGGIVLLYVFLLILSHIGSVLTPFFLALVLVYILRPIVDFLEARGLNRLVALIAAYVVAIVLLTVSLIFLVPLLVVQIQEFVRNFPIYFKAASEVLAPYKNVIDRGRVDPSVVGVLEAGLAKAQESGMRVFSSVPAYTLSAVGLLFNLILAPLIAFYLLKDLEAIKETAISLFPLHVREEIVELLQEVDRVLAGFLRGQSLVALSIGVLSTLALVLMGVDYPVVIGLITGLLSVIPYFGAILGAAIAGIVAVFNDPLLALIVFVVLLAIQGLASTFVAPYIMSQQVNVHPVVVILSLLIGGALFGAVGLVMAIPLAAIAKAVFLHVVEHHYPHYAPSNGSESLLVAEPEAEGE